MVVEHQGMGRGERGGGEGGGLGVRISEKHKNPGKSLPAESAY